MFVTSSICLSMKATKKILRILIANRFEKCLFWSLFQHSYTKMQYTLLSLKVKLLRDHICLYCFSVEVTRYGQERFFVSHRHKRNRKREINDLKHIFQFLQNYVLHGRRIIEPEIMKCFLIKWSNWSFSRSNRKNGHVTHHFKAYSIITISILLFRKKHSKANNFENTHFSIFLEMTS